MSYFVIIRGPLGCGKTTIAKKLSKILKAEYFSIDEVLAKYKLDKVDSEAETIPVENFIQANKKILPKVRTLLKKNVPVIFDGNFQHKQALEHLKQELPYQGYIFTLKAPLRVCIERDMGRAKSYGVDAVKALYKLTHRFAYGTTIDASQPLDTSIQKIISSIPLANLLETSISSRRLLLQPMSLKYKKVIFREFTDEITVHMTPQPAKHIGETEKFIRDSVENMRKGKELVMAILNKKTKEFLGCAGLHKINTMHPELGIWIKKPAHGRRYGREAMAVLKQWADKNLQYEYITYPVVIKNIASRKIPESLGGKVVREFKKKSMGGRVLHEVEYRIYPQKI